MSVDIAWEIYKVGRWIRNWDLLIGLRKIIRWTVSLLHPTDVYMSMPWLWVFRIQFQTIRSFYLILLDIFNDYFVGQFNAIFPLAAYKAKYTFGF